MTRYHASPGHFGFSCVSLQRHVVISNRCQPIAEFLLLDTFHMGSRKAVDLHRAAPLSEALSGGVTVARQGSRGRAALELEPQPLGSDVTPDLTNESACKLRIRKGRNANHQKGGY